MTAIDAQRDKRQKALERQVERLARQIDRLRAMNRRFSWYRLGALILGGGLVWLAAANLEMVYAWGVFLAALALFVGVVVLHNRLDGRMARWTVWHEMRSRQLARMRLDWEHIPASAPFSDLLERCSLDVDLDLSGPRSLHQLIDLAVSREGSCLLARWLTQSEPDLVEIASRQEIVKELVGMRRFRDHLLLDLRLYSREQLKGAQLIKWLSVEYSTGRLKWLLRGALGLALLNVTLFGLNRLGMLPAYWMLSMGVYLGLYFYSAGLLNQFLTAVVEMDTELGKFDILLRHLEKFPYGKYVHVAKLCEPFRDKDSLPSVQLRWIKLITVATGLRMNPVLGFLLNALLPWDFIFASLAGRLRERLVHSLPIWLETWYQLEGLCSLADFAFLNPEYSFPEIKAEVAPVLDTVDMGHPLIPAQHKVCNTFCLNAPGEVLILTGSNMAGKSTFLKTIGVNLRLAYAGGPVNAARWRSLPFRLYSCMRITDSLSDGFSYFYAEVKCLKHLLDALQADDRRPALYLIDEIFKGTNNRERLLGSRAYIRTLVGAHGCGLIATHDLELAGLAEESPLVKNFHFRDQVQDGRLVFDYRFLPGPCPTTNALKIMQMEGLPVDHLE